MTTAFPGALDSYSVKADNVDTVLASHVNDLQDAVVALETLARQANNNLLPDSLSTDASWLDGTSFADATDDTYIGALWNNVNVTNPPDWSRQAGASTDPFQYYLRCTHDADSQAGIVQFLEAKDTIPLRGKTLSLSADLWGTNVGTLRMAVLEWTSTADSVTSDVVAAWGAGNPTLAASWAYIGTPAAISISGTRARKAVNGLTVGTSTNNLAVFIWTDAVEASGDLWNVARVKLEIADEATDFVARSYEAERALIQRFYCLTGDAGGYPSGFVRAASTSVARGYIPLPTDMRIAPALTLSGTVEMRGAGAARTVTSVDTPGIDAGSVRANFNDSGAGLTANEIYAINGIVIADARL